MFFTTYNPMTKEEVDRKLAAQPKAEGKSCTCLIGKSFKAALKPDKSDYLFFVLSADLDGTSRFTSDYNQFLKDKDEYYEAYNAAHSK